MEKTINRVLAYQLAIEINPDDLDDISGGANPTVRHLTYKITGAYNSTDCMYDY